MRYMMTAVCCFFIVVLMGCATTSSTEVQSPAGRNGTQKQQFEEGWSEDGLRYIQCFPGFRKDQINLAGALAEQDMGKVVAWEECIDSGYFKAINTGLLHASRTYYFFEEGFCILFQGQGFSRDGIKVYCDDS